MEVIAVIKQSAEIDFTVMGFGQTESSFLNWCMSEYDNLQFIRKCKTLEKASQQSVLHHDQFKVVAEIDDVIKNKKT